MIRFPVCAGISLVVHGRLMPSSSRFLYPVAIRYLEVTRWQSEKAPCRILTSATSAPGCQRASSTSCASFWRGCSITGENARQRGSTHLVVGSRTPAYTHGESPQVRYGRTAVTYAKRLVLTRCSCRYFSGPPAPMRHLRERELSSSSIRCLALHTHRCSRARLHIQQLSEFEATGISPAELTCTSDSVQYLPRRQASPYTPLALSQTGRRIHA